MFCYQCEQTSKGRAAPTSPYAARTKNSAILQDLLVHATKGVAQYAHRARAAGRP